MVDCWLLVQGQSLVEELELEVTNGVSLIDSKIVSLDTKVF